MVAAAARADRSKIWSGHPLKDTRPPRRSELLLAIEEWQVTIPVTVGAGTGPWLGAPVLSAKRYSASSMFPFSTLTHLVMP